MQIEKKPLGIVGQTILLFKKNAYTKIRLDRKKLLSEILVPVFYLVILAFITKIPGRTTFDEINKEYETPQDLISGLKYLAELNFNSKTKLTIYAVPNEPKDNLFTDSIKDIYDKYDLPASSKISLEFIHLDNESILADIQKNINSTIYLVLIRNGDGKFTIRTDSDMLYKIPSPKDKKVGLDTCRPKGQIYGPLQMPLECPVNAYFYSAFLGLQKLVDQAYLQKEMNEKNENQNITISVKMENYPKSQYNAGVLTFLRVIIPLYLVLPLAQLINNLLMLIVTEKEHKIKDGLKMIGVSDLAYWGSWFLFYAIYIFVISLLFTIGLHLADVLVATNPAIIFILFLLFGFSVITLAFAISPFFHKPKTAGMVGTLVLQFASLIFLIQIYVENSKDSLIPLRLISSLAFSTALDEIAAFEYLGGIQYYDLTFSGRGKYVLYSILFLIFDIIFYGFLAFYLDNVVPNQFGVHKHPLFCFNPRYWFGKKKEQDEIHLIDDFDGPEINESDRSEDFERVPSSFKEAIRIHNLKKTFKSFRSKPIEAVKGISMSIYESQITAILGKNGAGKSTIFNMLTGLVMPTSGKSIVFGLDTRNSYDLDKLRKLTGVCLQYDLHFPAFSPEEHLNFYGRIRGLRGDELLNEIDIILNELKLNDCRKLSALKLSGGQKRKLSVGIALIGDPQIILLDEPTAGVDVVSRRHLWSLLQRKKEGKVILLTTHFLDEADILADRKAIIHDGILKCVGSSLFLKNRFGVGYYLTVETSTRNPDSQKSDQIIGNWIPTALQSKKIISNEIKYALPLGNVSQFPGLFKEFESEIEREGTDIKSYGVSMTSLEEVFLKISNDIDLHAKNTSQSEEHYQNEEQNLINESENSAIQIKRWEIITAMCKLRTLRLTRSPQNIFFMIVLPLIFIALGFFLIRKQNVNISETSLSFNNPSAFYEKSELNIALSGLYSQEFVAIMEANSFSIKNYSGNFEDLLKLEKEDLKGTFSALNINNEKEEENGYLLDVNLRINGTFLHSPPFMMNLIDKYVAQKLNLTMPEVLSKPFNSKSEQPFDPNMFSSIFFLGPGLLFSCVGMVIEIVNDREIKARNNLRVNGLNFINYFLPFYIVYGFLSLIMTIGVVALIYIFQVESLTSIYPITIIITLSILFIFPCLLFSTVFSYLFDRMETAQSIFSQLTSWSASLLGILVMVIDIAVANKTTVFLVHIFCSAINVYYIPFAIFYWTNKKYLICKVIENNCDELGFGDYFFNREILTMYIVLFIQIPVYFLMLLGADIIYYGGFSSLLTSLRIRKNSINCTLESESMNMNGYSQIEDDISEEKRKVKVYMAGEEVNENCVVAVENLRKKYKVKEKGKRKKEYKYVLKGIDLMVEKGEIFGLLGHNGAGKTTAMKIIIAEEAANYGKVKINNQLIYSNQSDAYLNLGYCAQFDSLWDNITLQEHIYLYSVIRGIPKKERIGKIRQFLDGLQIVEHAKKKSEKLSGGTKRKLSYCLSMLGNPKIVILDECSTGLDPQSKRFLWNTILGTFKEHRGALLTTHSLEEADALCTKIAIMVKGLIVSIGSPQHLKSKYGTGYTLEVKLKIEDVGNEINHHLNRVQGGDNNEGDTNDNFGFIRQNFPDSRLVEFFGNRAVFSIPNSNVKSISDAFRLLEDLKIQYNIEEYSFSQTTLEQVFLTIGKDNEENEEH